MANRRARKSRAFKPTRAADFKQKLAAEQLEQRAKHEPLLEESRPLGVAIRESVEIVTLDEKRASLSPRDELTIKDFMSAAIDEADAMWKDG